MGRIEKRAAATTTQDVFEQRLRAATPTLSPALLRVATYIDQNRAITLATPAAELGVRIGTSDATVIRAVQSLGFDGLAELRKVLTATLEPRATAAENMRRTLTEGGQNAQQAIGHVLDAHREAIEALRAPRSRANILAAVTVLAPTDRILVFGIGPSAPIASYVAVLLNRSGRAAAPLDSTGIGLADQLLNLRRGDALLAMAYGRPYREALVTLAEAKRMGLPVVLVTDTEKNSLTRRADIVVLARRGRAERVAIHAATLAVLEAIVLGLASCDRATAVGTLERLNDLREQISGPR